jgi:hypothetical protein
MKTIFRILTLTLVLAGTYSAAFSTPQPNNKANFGGAGDPVPLCDPANPNCTINGVK